MFTNQEHCTIWQKTVQNHAPAWTRHTLGAVYAEETEGQEKTQGQGNLSRNPVNQLFLVIPESSLDGYVPQSGDRVLSFLCEDFRPPDTAFTITKVKPFLYGSEDVHHLEVTAE